jgi:hypothetical protein
VDIGAPVANVPPQQQVGQPPVAKPPNVQPLIALRYIPPAPPVAAAQLPILVISVTLPPKPFTSDSRKHQQLEAIPEEEKPIKSQHRQLKEALLSDSDKYGTLPDTPAIRPAGRGVRRPDSDWAGVQL